LRRFVEFVLKQFQLLVVQQLIKFEQQFIFKLQLVEFVIQQFVFKLQLVEFVVQQFVFKLQFIELFFKFIEQQLIGWYGDNDSGEHTGLLQCGWFGRQ
jgi:hypothetical protein